MADTLRDILRAEMAVMTVYEKTKFRRELNRRLPGVVAECARVARLDPGVMSENVRKKRTKRQPVKSN